MSKQIREDLSEHERSCLEYLRLAQELDVSLGEYCRSFDLPVDGWDAVRQGLVRKGVIAAGAGLPKGQVKPPEAKKSVGFAPVRVVSSPVSSTLTWRLHHPSGWSIECSGVPEVSWIRALVSGVAA